MTPYSPHFNDLNPAEAERLAILAEECAETIQVIGKILRHGYESHDPTRPPNQRPSNREMLQREIGHINAAVARMLVGEDLVVEAITLAHIEKLERAEQYLHHQRS